MPLAAVTVRAVVKTILSAQPQAWAQQANLATLKPLTIVRELDDAALAGD